MFDILSVYSEDEEHTDNSGVESYKAACQVLHITPTKKVLDGLLTKQIYVPYMGLGVAGVKALTAALTVSNWKIYH